MLIQDNRFYSNNNLPIHPWIDTGNYAWDRRYTAIAVVNWIRAGFGLPAVE